MMTRLADSGLWVPRHLRGEAGSVLVNPYSFGGKAVDAANFDGTNDYATRGAGLTGAADSKLMTLAVWLKPDASTLQYILQAQAGQMWVEINGSGKINVQAANAGTTTILDVTSTNAIGTSAWKCVLASFDLTDTAKRFLYFGDSSELTVGTYTNDTMDFTVSNWAVGATTGGASKYNGGMAELLFWPGVYVDFSSQSNRRLFVDGSGKWVDPTDASGAIATLGAPIIYFHLNDGETANNFVANNDGGATGGAFSVTGSLSTYASSPSD